MGEFGSSEHIRSLSRRKLENLFRYVFNSRNDLNTIITQQDAHDTGFDEGYQVGWEDGYAEGLAQNESEQREDEE